MGGQAREPAVDQGTGSVEFRPFFVTVKKIQSDPDAEEGGMKKPLAWMCALVMIGSVMAADAAQNKRAASAKTSNAAKASNAAQRSAQEAVAQNESATSLPVERVVLYKSGVGYFEHEGRVRGDQSVSIDFTSGQLNDVLQSLTVLDLGGGRIAGVSYNSEAPLSQRLGALRLPLAENTDVSQFYGALRGARLEIRSGNSTITGRLLSVEQKTNVTGVGAEQVALATVVSDTGEVRSVEITPAVTVHLADRDVTSEVQNYLSLLASERQADLRKMTIQAEGTGERELYVSYISEVPIWKTTYRIVLPSKPGEEPLLQGWAIVDNTVGEDWDNVQLSLVAGAPQSFIQQLSQPYYSRRPVVPLPQNAQLTPQTHESAMEGGVGALSGQVTDATGAAVSGVQLKLYDASGEVLATASTDNQGKYEFGDVPGGSYRLEASSPGFQTSAVHGVALGGGRESTQNVALQVGSSAETVIVRAAPSTIETETSTVSSERTGNVGNGSELGGSGRSFNGMAELSSGAGNGMGRGTGPELKSIGEARREMEAAARGVDLGDLFEYKLKDRVTIRKNESALVPIVQAHVKAEKVSLWNTSLGSERPLRAIWLTNTSGLTLDGGSFSVLEDETFAGEGLTDPIKPGERRLVSYASDLGVRVESSSQSDSEPVTHVSIAHGMMVQTRELQQETTYTVRDDDTTPRTVIVEHPLRTGWALAPDGPKPEETTSSVYRFLVSVEPKATESLEVREARPIATSYALTNINGDLVALFVRQKSITPEIQAALEKIIAQKNRVAELQDEVDKRANERQQIFDDQQRLRENLKVLKGTPEEKALTERYVQQLNDEETRLGTLQKESADYSAQRDKAQQDLDAMIESMSFDTTL